MYNLYSDNEYYEYGNTYYDVSELNIIINNHPYVNNHKFLDTCEYIFINIGAFLLVEICNNKLYIHVIVNKNIQLSDNCRYIENSSQVSHYNKILYNFYTELMEKKYIKNLLIIQNFGDFPIIRNDLLHPKHLWKKNIIINKKDNLLNIFSYCKNSDYTDKLIPSPDLMRLVLRKIDCDHFDNNYCLDWNLKVNKLIFRGTNTSGYTKNKNSRMLLQNLSKIYPDLIDAKIIKNCNYPLLLDNNDTVQYVTDDLYEQNEYKTLMAQSLYKYQIHIDGFVSAWRLAELLFMKSLIFRVNSQWYEYYYENLKPWIHYIPIKQDLSDLVEKLNWCIDNDNICKKIMENSYNFAIENLNYDSVINHTYNVVKNYNIT